MGAEREWGWELHLLLGFPVNQLPSRGAGSVAKLLDHLGCDLRTHAEARYSSTHLSPMCLHGQGIGTGWCQMLKSQLAWLMPKKPVPGKEDW